MELIDRSLSVFEEAIKSKETKKQYRYLLGKFVDFVQKEYLEVRKASDLLQLNNNYLQEQLEDYLIFCKKRIGHSSIKVRFASLELFFSMNDRILNFKKIRKRLIICCFYGLPTVTLIGAPDLPANMLTLAAAPESTGVRTPVGILKYTINC